MITDTVGQVTDKARIAEMETLMCAAGESVKKAMCFLTTESPAHIYRAASTPYRQTTNAFLVKTTQTENASQTASHSCEDNPEPGHIARIVGQRIKALKIQVETVEIIPTEYITKQSKDNNWCWGKKTTRCAEKAVFR